MDIKKRMQGDVIIVELSGKLDAGSSSETQNAITTSAVSGCKLVINMSQCSYVSSAGLRALLIIARHLAQIGGKGALTGLIDEVKDVLEMTGFDSIFKSFGSVEEAVSALQKEEL